MTGPKAIGPKVIGVVNNMPDAALRQTQAQFTRQLEAALPGCEIVLQLFSLPELPRSSLARRAMQSVYRPFAEVFTADLDGLIVTGFDPGTEPLPAQPCWASLIALIDHAAACRLPSVFSCLAAHAAVLRLAGVGRVRRLHKLSGVFGTLPAETAHPYAAAVPARWWTPHSRWHGLDEAALGVAGFRVLSRIATDTGPEADGFTLDGLPFLFLQGHPEYASRTLLGEYVRDAGRFIGGAATGYPRPPEGYFTAATEAALAELQAQAAAAAAQPGSPAGHVLMQALHAAASQAELLPLPDQAAHGLLAGWAGILDGAGRARRDRLRA